jgi:hypothetical protein
MIARWAAIGVLGALALFLAWDFTRGVLLYDPLGQVALETEVTETQASAPGEFRPGWNEAIVRKNLFREDRGQTPPSPPPSALNSAAAGAPEPTVPDRAPNVKLNGIIKNQFGEYVAYVQIETAPAIALRAGDMVSGLNVERVDQRSVVLLFGPQRLELTLPNKSIFQQTR